jgi:addiction module RelE/StbE family toxin
VKVVIRETAAADLKRIHDWISKDSPINAHSVAERILTTIESKIPAFPGIGRRGKVDGTREWIVRGLPYIIVYRVDAGAQTVTVISIFHGAQSR